jgi:hypothetical protein
MLAAVPPYAALCRFVRGILVGNVAGTRTCGILWGRLRSVVAVGFGDDEAAGAGLVVDDGDGPYPVDDAIADPLADGTAASPAPALRAGRGSLLDGLDV